MASRRLNSDRYFTTDFTPEVYTPTGMAWLEETSMIDIVLRHYPQLRPALRGVTRTPSSRGSRVERAVIAMRSGAGRAGPRHGGLPCRSNSA